MLLKAVITAFPSVSLPFLAVPLLSQRTVAIKNIIVRDGDYDGDDSADAFTLENYLAVSSEALSFRCAYHCLSI
eukprot:SAG22_NODE_110_length_19679_cov_45.046527_16_plen_74_part_00